MQSWSALRFVASTAYSYVEQPDACNKIACKESESCWKDSYLSQWNGKERSTPQKVAALRRVVKLWKLQKLIRVKFIVRSIIWWLSTILFNWPPIQSYNRCSTSISIRVELFSIAWSFSNFKMIFQANMTLLNCNCSCWILFLMSLLLKVIASVDIRKGEDSWIRQLGII